MMPDNVVRFVVLFLIFVVLIAVPLKILNYGYFPPDDIRRHAAKAVSGKSWDQILVLKEDIQVDPHPGWHVFLRVIHKAFSLDVEGLMAFSIIGLFLLYTVIPPLTARFPEVWLMVLSIISVANPRLIKRLLQGRPYIITMAVIVFISFFWKKLKEEKPEVGVYVMFVLAVWASVWMHASWYLFALPAASFFLAREFRVGVRFSFCVLAGVLLGAVFTGTPVIFLKQTLLHVIRIFAQGEMHSFLVEEFKPFEGDRFMVIAILGCIAWRHIKGTWDIKRLDTPVFILGVMGWIGAFFAKRFWFDIGVPALSFWMVTELDSVFMAIEKQKSIAFSRRVIFTLIFGAVFFLSFTNDANKRWTKAVFRQYIDFNKPELKEWVGPGGGIIYNSHMDVFFDTFRKNPHASWRYMVGFEAAMMPNEDIKIYRNIRRMRRADKSFKYWVRKMTPSDLMIIRKTGGSSSRNPQISELEWKYVNGGYWIGKKKGN